MAKINRNNGMFHESTKYRNKIKKYFHNWSEGNISTYRKSY